MEPMIGIDKEGLPDEEPERSEGNRPPSEYCILATANEQGDDTKQNRLQNIILQAVFGVYQKQYSRITQTKKWSQ